MAKICPVHLFSRQTCTYRCAWQRKELEKLNNDYRQYWFDRRHGIKPMSKLQYQLRYGMLNGVATTRHVLVDDRE